MEIKRDRYLNQLISYIVSLILAVLSVMVLIPVVAASAEQSTEPDEVIWLENGDYIIVTTQTISTYASGTITKNKHGTYYGADDNPEWKVTLTGTFTYNGTSSTCTSSSCSVSIYDNHWYLVSKSAGKSGNTATATATLGYKSLGVTVGKRTYNLTLTCDKNGNVSYS